MASDSYSHWLKNVAQYFGRWAGARSDVGKKPMSDLATNPEGKRQATAISGLQRATRDEPPWRPFQEP